MDKDLEFKLDENAASQPSGDKYGEIVIIVVIIQGVPRKKLAFFVGNLA